MVGNASVGCHESVTVKRTIVQLSFERPFEMSEWNVVIEVELSLLSLTSGYWVYGRLDDRCLGDVT